MDSYSLPVAGDPRAALADLCGEASCPDLKALITGAASSRPTKHDIVSLLTDLMREAKTSLTTKALLAYFDNMAGLILVTLQEGEQCKEKLSQTAQECADILNRNSDLESRLDTANSELLEARQDLARESIRVDTQAQLLELFSKNQNSDPHTAATEKKHSTASDPDKFSATEKSEKRRYLSYKAWRGAICMRWRADAHEFPSEMKKICHAAGRLKDVAYERMSTGLTLMLDNPDNADRWLWKTGEEFLEALDRKYITIDVAAKAEEDLELLQQEGKYKVFSDFFTEYESLCEQCNLDEAAKVRNLRAKVSEPIRDLLKTVVPQPERNNYEAWAKLITGFARNQEHDDFHKKHPISRRHPGPGNNNHNSGNGNNGHGNTGAQKDPDAMDLDAVRVNRVSPQEMERRINNDLCKRCGGSGHFALQCTPAHRLKNAGNAPVNNNQGRGRGRGGYNDYAQTQYGQPQRGGYNNYAQTQYGQPQRGGYGRGRGAYHQPARGGYTPYTPPHAPHGPAVRTTDIGDYAPPRHPQGGIQKRGALAPRPTIIPDGGGYVEGEVDDDDDWYEEGKE